MAFRKYRRTFRRRRPFSGRRMFRRRRFGRKRGRTTSWTMQNGTGKGLQYRSRRLRKRTYRRMLWKDTMFKDHWRSALVAVSAVSTPATVNTMTVEAFVVMTQVGTDTGAFWTTAGGAIEKDLNKGVPLFRGITIRGGVTKIKVVLPPGGVPTANDMYLCKIWMVWTNAAPQFTNVPSGAVSTAWDPSMMTDFDTEVGRTVLVKEFNMSVNINPVVEVEYRLRCQKIDMDQYAFQNGLQPMWVIGLANISSNTSVECGVFVEHNVSFAGDAVQPPPTGLQEEVDKLKEFVHFKEPDTMNQPNDFQPRPSVIQTLFS